MRILPVEDQAKLRSFAKKDIEEQGIQIDAVRHGCTRKNILLRLERTITGGMAMLLATLTLTLAQAAEVRIPATDGWAAALSALRPGDVALLEAARYTGGGKVTMQGAPGRPVILRGAGHLLSVFDGEGRAGQALGLIGCRDVILENVVVTNPSPRGFDGRENYSSTARNRLPEGAPGRAALAEGLIIGDSVRVTVRHCRFTDIATRGVFAYGACDALAVERSLFLRIGDDTAGSDIALGGGVRWSIRENLLAGNVDGVVTDGRIGAGGLIERNLMLFHKWENHFDLKSHKPRGSEGEWSTLRHNVLYGIHNRFPCGDLADGTDGVKVYGNVFYGSGSNASASLLIRGRANSAGDDALHQRIEIVGNWFDASGQPGRGTGLKLERNSTQPAGIEDVHIAHNLFAGYQAGVMISQGTRIRLDNNLFLHAPVLVGTPSGAVGGRNLFDATPSWGDEPILGTPSFTTAPVGPLAPGSPGKGRALPIREHDWGPDIGLPASLGDLPGLEASILAVLERVFSPAEIRECMEQGAVPYLPQPLR